MYKILPETESRSLEEIEIHFSDNQRKLTDRKILKTTKNKEQKSNESAAEKGVCVISDMVEMNKNSPSVVGAARNGCDNKAFSMDR